MESLAVSTVQEYTVDGDTLAFSCRVDPTESDRDAVRTVPVEIRFLSPGVFTFEMHANPEADGRESAVEYDEAAVATDVEPTVRVEEAVLVAETDELEMRVGLDEWSFTIRDADGNVRLREQRSDENAKGRRRTDPLRVVEESVNGWPYRVARTGTAFELQSDERIYGLGEKFTEFDKRGREINAWITQPNGAETEAAYKNVPFYLSTAGYGLLVDTAQKTTFDFGRRSTVTTDIAVEDDSFRFFYFNGPEFEDIVREYTALTGRPHRPPKWSFGVWMSRLGYESRAELEGVAHQLRDHEIPCDVLHLDPFWMDADRLCDLTWDRDSFPDPEEMIADLHELGFKLSLWEYPYVQVSSPCFEEFAERGYFVTDGTGDPYVLSRLSTDNRGAILDFTDSEVREWWADRHRELVAMGVDAFKLDFGEYLPRDAVLSNDKTGAAMRNRYPRLYQSTVYDALREAGHDRPVLWVRAAWTGDQEFPIHWGGDPNTTFGSMAASLRGGLSLSLSGFPFWGCDIGGFRGEPSTELYIRWAQWCLLGTSHARFHGTTPREPWEFGDEAERIVRRYARERYRLLPYLYSYAERASRTGLPVMRPLILEFQDDPAVADLATEYLLGEELLVAPMLDEDGQRRVYFPEGEWVDYWTGERYVGQSHHTLDVDLETLPLFVRAGSIVPKRDPTPHVGAGENERLHLDVVFSRAGPAPENKETAATFRYFDDDSDRLQDLRARYDGTRLAIEAPVAVDIESVTVDGVATSPSTVTLRDDRLEQVDAVPGAGEWTYDAAAEACHVGPVTQ